MAESDSSFTTILLQAAKPDNGEPWAFLVLPKQTSEILPRRGRTSVTGTINGQAFTARLEPDGQLSHWLKVDTRLQEAAKVTAGDTVSVTIAPVENEPEPPLPADFAEALGSSEEARAVWDNTTTLARVDWIHWIESAKQAKTRNKRIKDACQMLAEGKKRVCCFDVSGFYSKGLKAPESL
jgi:hypothetical protein